MLYVPASPHVLPLPYNLFKAYICMHRSILYGWLFLNPYFRLFFMRKVGFNIVYHGMIIVESKAFLSQVIWWIIVLEVLFAGGLKTMELHRGMTDSHD